MKKHEADQLVVCVDNDGYPASLETRKIYVALDDAGAAKHGMLRIVDVIGATVTEFNTAIAESRVRISTGRLLSGVLNVYQQISPRFTWCPSPARCSRRRIPLA